jgi:radical SAM protein with 4Fe4S-binding SPASM domain
MKAKIKPRINLEGRTKLETVIPLSTPFILFVDPSSACNFQCKFCPTGDRHLIRDIGRWQGTMKFALYTKIIDDLKEFDRPLKVLRLYKEGEPLLNPCLPEMIRYAKDLGVADYIDTTTNGSLLTNNLSLRLVGAGLDRINISVDAMSDDQFLEFTRTKVNFESYVERVKFLYDNRQQCEICVKIAGDYLSDAEKKRFFEVFGDISDRIFIENTAPCWPEFDVEQRTGITISKGIYDNPIAEVHICPYIFYSMSVNSDGSVSLCFLDWARKLIIGDARTQSLREIWSGKKLFNYQMVNLKGERTTSPVCSQCGQLSHCLPDNIDTFSEILREKLKKSRVAHD